MDRYRVFVQTKISADGGWVPYIDAQRAIEEVHQQYGGRASEYEARIAALESDLALPAHDLERAIAKGEEFLARIAELERERDEARARVADVSRRMCGCDAFPGDLGQYVQNEIDGRANAEARVAELDLLVVTAGEQADAAIEEGNELRKRVTELERERDEVRARAENLPPGSTESDDRDPGASGCTGERK